MNWTDEIKEQIAEMLREGLSASQIATRIGGVTRNAVIGVIRRDKRLKSIGFTRSKGESDDVRAFRAKRISEAKRRKSADAPKRIVVAPAPSIVDLLDAVHEVPGRFGPPQVAGVSLTMLNECRCKWPINDGGPFIFCGEAKKPDRPYCPFHATEAVGKGTESERTAVRSALKIAA